MNCSENIHVCCPKCDTRVIDNTGADTVSCSAFQKQTVFFCWFFVFFSLYQKACVARAQSARKVRRMGRFPKQTDLNSTNIWLAKLYKCTSKCLSFAFKTHQTFVKCSSPLQAFHSADPIFSLSLFLKTKVKLHYHDAISKMDHLCLGRNKMCFWF